MTLGQPQPHRVIVTGAPGAGKTTLLAELARRGYATFDDSARAIIAERLARGESPRPEPLAFAREILRRDIEKYEAAPPDRGWSLFDRSLLEAVGMVHDAAPLSPAELQAFRERYRYHPTVFVLPPWPEIYVNDAERDHPFAHALRVHEEIVRWYALCGYATLLVPCVAVPERAEFVLRALA